MASKKVDAKAEVVVVVGKQVYVSAEGAVRPAAVFIKQGVIVAIGQPTDPIPAGAKVHRLKDDAVLLPGIVDSHVHVNDPGRTDWEGFITATQAALAGGVTTIADMPLNSIPPTTTVANLQAKTEVAQDKAWCNVRFIGGAIHNNADDLQGLVEAGVCGFKCFLIDSGVPEFTPVTVDQARLALQQLSGTGSFLMFHAEMAEEDDDEDHTHGDAADVDNEVADPTQYVTFLRSRPTSMENRAIAEVVKLCEETKVHCHIVHLSSAEALDTIRSAKSRGVPLTVETCYHYLFFNAEDMPSGQPRFKCCPPIREAANREKLWAALQEGVIDMVVSDHSPCTPQLKATADYLAAWGGISSLQFGLSIMNTKREEHKLSYSDLVRWLCEQPAKLIGVDGCKGKIQVGYDADLVVFNPAAKWTVESSNMMFKNKISAYQGLELSGLVEQTFLAGRVAFENGKVLDEQPQGKLILSKRVAAA